MSEPVVATLSIREAAEACGVSARTIRRRLGEFPNRARDGRGAWRIPAGDLEAAGLRPNRPRGPDVAGDRDELAELRAEVVALRSRVAVAEALASERSARIDDLRTALRALPAPVEAKRARWWRRGTQRAGESI